MYFFTSFMTEEFSLEKKEFIYKFNQYLEQFIKSYKKVYPYSNEIIDAVIYSTITSGGKRLRPLLVYGAARVLGGSMEQVTNAAAAIELVHCYSLIHDDLPSMDNHDTRRGIPSCHSKFGEANAILAGDLMQVIAFGSINSSCIYSSTTKEKMSASIIKASTDIVCGQAIDLKGEKKQLDLTETEIMHRLKCGALIKASLQLGILSMGNELNNIKNSFIQLSEEDLINKITSAGDKIGLGFQIKDDLMDLDEEGMNNTGIHKSTYPAIVGIQKSKQRIEELLQQALADIESLPKNADFLRELFRQTIKITH